MCLMDSILLKSWHWYLVPRETPVWCMIYDDLNYTQEADIFANQMKYVKPLLPYEIFMANIEAGSEKN